MPDAQNALPTADEWFAKATAPVVDNNALMDPAATASADMSPSPASITQDSRPTADEWFAKATAGPGMPSPLDLLTGPLQPMGSAAPINKDALPTFANSSVGRILKAVGHGLEEPWTTGGPLGLSPETKQALTKAGVFNDWQKGDANIVKAFNEGVMVPAAAGLDALFRVGVSAVTGVEAGVAQTAKEAGAPALGRDIAGMIEAGTTNPAGVGLPSVPPVNLPMARDLGVIGKPEAVFEGTVPEEAAAPVEAAKEAAPPVEEAAPEPAPTPAPAEATPAQAAAEAPVAPPDVHALARQIDPVTFNEFDALTQHRDDLSSQIGAMQAQLRAEAEAQAPHAAEIADLEARLQDTTPRLAKKYQARLDELRPAHDAFLSDEFTMSALMRDTPEIADLRTQLLETDFRMRDLAPQVSAAYRQAAEQMPAPEAPAEAPVEQPTQAPQVAQEAAPQAAAPETPAAPEQPVEPAPTPEEKPVVAPVSIAEDVSRKLQAAGRPKEEADAAAAVTERLWQIRAQRFGGAKGTPEEMYAREAPEIRGERVREREMAQKGRTLEQGVEKLDWSRGGGIKSAIGNRGTFEPGNPNILHQVARGKIRLTDDGRGVITLMRNANASTFLHEMGHDWLERMMRDARDPAAPADLRADAETVRKYLGLEGDAISTRAHEKFARSFERYFMEGRAPSQGVAGVFAKFKQWLTQIYDTVSRLRAPITADIRDVFDRMLATPEERAAAIVPEPETEPAASARPAMEPLFAKPPKEPTRLVSFIRKLGGVRDEGGDIAHILGGSRVRPGLINNATGLTLDEAALRAWEAGYFPEAGETRPTINDLRDALAEDLNGNARYSEHDTEAAQAYNDAVQHNAKIERLAHSLNIDTTGMTRAEFYSVLSEHLSLEEKTAEIASQDAAHEEAFGEAREEALDYFRAHDEATTSDAIYGIEGPRTEAELEDAFRQANASGPMGQGPAAGGEPVSAAGRAEPGEEGAGSRGGVAGASGGAGGEQRPGGSTAPSERDAAPKRPNDAREPFGEPESDLVDKAGNIRLDNINSTEDVNAVLKQVAADNEDFWGARRGTVSDSEVQDFADALGVSAADVNIDRLRAMSVEDDSPLAARIKAARQLLVQSARAVHQAMLGDDPVAYEDAVQRHLRIQETVSGITAEWGRAGRAFRMLADQAAQAQELSQFLQANTGRDLFQIKREMKLGAALQDPAQVAKFINDSQKPGFSDMLLEYFINNLISGPITHKSILVGEIALAFMKAVPETAVSAAIGTARAALGDTGPRVYWGEIPAQVAAIIRGQRDAVHAGWAAIKTGVTQMLPGESEEGARGSLITMQPTRYGANQGAIPNPEIMGVKVPLGTAIRLPSRGVAALHSYVRSMNYAQSIARQAYEASANEGLEGAAAWARAAELQQNPTRAMMQKAVKESTEQALMGRGGEFTERLAALTNTKLLGVPMKFIMPFVRISSNVATQGLLERSPLGLIDAGIRDNLMGRNGPQARDAQIGRVVSGSIIAGSIMSLATQGLVTGAAPSDPKQAQVWRDTGRMPYSVRIGDFWHSYGRLGPLGKIMGVAADIQEYMHAAPNETVQQAAWALIGGVAKSMVDDSFMRGPSDLIKAIEDPARYGSTYVKDLAGGFIPYSVGMSQTAREIDPFMRQARSLIDSFKDKVPGLSQTLVPSVGIWGQPVRTPEFAGPAETFFSASNPVHTDPVDDALRSLNFYPAMPRRIVRGVSLTDQQYHDYAQMAGRLSHMRLQQTIGVPGFNLLPDGEKIQVIREIITSSRQAAQGYLFMRYPALIKQATDTKLTILQTGRKPPPQ